MATIKLLELNRWNGLKGNVICQLLAPSRSISLDNVEEKKSYMVIVDNGVRYCLTGNEGVYDEDSPYVILTDRTPTKQKLINGQIKQKRWIKHPKQAEATTEEVVKSWENKFHFKLEGDEAHPGLRKPQLGALHALLSHLLAPAETATVVLPTGTGKTETMLSALVAGRCKRVLVTVPTNALRGQLFDKFKTLGVLKTPRFGIIAEDALYPIVGLISTSFENVELLKSFVCQCNVVVTTMQIIDNALKDLPVAVLNHYGEDFAGSGHLYITRLLGRTDQERRDVIVKMAERGIACNVHYKPLPMMTAYKALGFDIKDYPNAYNLYVNEVTLPLHTRLTDDDVEYVISNYVDIIKNL